jgi:glyoxylase-like metal-dependent hydrolase (beta-lactamase superfamily II)
VAFTEIADRVWVARYEWFDVNVTLVGGDRGLLVVDTHASDLAARAVIDDVRRLGAAIGSQSVVGVVNTHEHFDHTFGNGAFRAAYGDIPIHAHEVAAERTVSAGERIKGLYDDDPEDPHRDEVQATEIVPADRTFSSAVSLDLGDRAVELVHPGRGHTGGDLVLRVPDVDVLLAGDLVEESMARNGVPGFGDDCYPLEWPHSLDIVLSLSTSVTVVVPGHGAPVDREFVEEQRNAIGIVAQTVRDLAARGVPADQALEAAEWPYPREELAAAVRRGYAHLSRSEKRLPMA